MDWLALQARMPRDADMPARSNRLGALEAVLEGRQYDVLPFAFSRERSEAGDYVPLDDRRPSVRTGLCRVVVEDSVSLLFSEGHWPEIGAADLRTIQALADLIRETHLNDIMLDAATRGSVGSVALLLRAVQRRPFVEVLGTRFLTPQWSRNDPRCLVRVTERYKVAATDLAALGYRVDPAAGQMWFERCWDDTAETWYLPVPVDQPGQERRVDQERSVVHDLGFVPIVWIRNISGDGGYERDPADGACTFSAAIDTVIEADYLLSQAGRGLKYGSDPTLVLKDPGAGLGGVAMTVRSGGASSALTLPPEGDAKLLEINGNAAAAVLAHVQELRAIALEAMHGNRAHGDRLSNAQSGRAIEMMFQGLIWLADRLRISYGECGLLALMRMVCAATGRVRGGLRIAGKDHADLDATGLSLVWPSWFPTTFADRQAQASTVATLVASGVIDRQAAFDIVAPLNDLQGHRDRLFTKVGRVAAGPDPASA
ncbi:phage portal protein [Lichenicoccus sp.]|uniref:phage portal protein n=1 Tax=Lichenicoccus sp. TaxID=2781899 RepID=UPI003D0D8BE0